MLTETAYVIAIVVLVSVVVVFVVFVVVVAAVTAEVELFEVVAVDVKSFVFGSFGSQVLMGACAQKSCVIGALGSCFGVRHTLS